MKIAILMHGLAGSTNKYGTGVPTDLAKALEHFEKNVRLPNKGHDIDVYMHSWSTEHEQFLVDSYEPIDRLFEEQIHFDFEYIVGDPNLPMNEGKTENGIFKGVENIRFHSLFSRWYSAKITNDLMNRSGKSYDAVMLTRFDLAYLEPIYFEKIDLQKLTIVPPISNHGIHDLFFISNQKMINTMSEMFDFTTRIKHFAHWGMHSHYLSAVWVKDKIGFENVTFFGSQRLWDAGLEGAKTGPAPLVRDHYDLFKIDETDPLELSQVAKIKEHIMKKAPQYSKIV